MDKAWLLVSLALMWIILASVIPRPFDGVGRTYIYIYIHTLAVKPILTLWVSKSRFSGIVEVDPSLNQYVDFVMSVGF